MNPTRSILLALAGIAGFSKGSDLDCGPVSIDLGGIPQGKNVTMERSCRNTSAQELVVLDILTGCSCLNARLDRKRIAPGGKSTLRLEFDSDPLADKVEFSVQILSKGKATSTETLVVSADVRPSVVAFPEYLDMGDFRRNNIRQILVVDTTGRAFSIRQATTSRSEVDVRWLPVELVRMGDKWEPATRGGAVTGYQVTVQSRAGTTRHSLSDEIQLELVHELQKTLRIRVVGYSP